MADALARSRAMLETAQSLARLAGVEVDHATGRIACTSGIAAILGLAGEPRTTGDLVAGMAPDCARAFLAHLADPAQPPFELEVKVRTTPQPRWVRVLRGPGGSAGARAVSTLVFQDVTAMREAREEVLRLNASLERRVQRRTRQLKAANRELEAFSYSVSHDLKAPLAAIDGFTHVLAERLQGRLDEREAGYMERVRAGVGNMFSLIDAMLALHQLSRDTPLQRTRVDVTALAQRIVAELREAEPGRRCDIRIEKGLAMLADEALLGIALRNLIGNAWKFSGRKPLVAIEVAEDPAGPEGTTTLRIADRGAGFDPARSDKLFMPFHRLHHAADFPGTGIGLATVQRIVQRHGGTIRADAVPETGATFWLSLPRAGAEGIDSMRGDEK